MHGLTKPQWRAIEHLMNTSTTGFRRDDIAALLTWTGQKAGRLCQMLETEGYVMRVHGAKEVRFCRPEFVCRTMQDMGKAGVAEVADEDLDDSFSAQPMRQVRTTVAEAGIHRPANAVASVWELGAL